jgi:putative PIN family toxin of toxin-antitoxin system
MSREVCVIDTNIWISFLLSKKYDTLVKIILENKLEIVTCKNLVTEFTQVLQRTKFKKYIRQKDIDEAVRIHLKLCSFIPVELKTNELTDKKDNYLLDLYRSANASLLVTGDKQLIAEASRFGVNVITLTQFEKLMVLL